MLEEKVQTMVLVQISVAVHLVVAVAQWDLLLVVAAGKRYESK